MNALLYLETLSYLRRDRWSPNGSSVRAAEQSTVPKSFGRNVDIGRLYGSPYLRYGQNS